MTTEATDPAIVPVPSVSVGLPVYNGERYLAGAIEAILNQTFADFELIICDNASIDATHEICERYAALDPRIRYIRNDFNLGAAANFNRCFELARGRYFKWAAHDDLVAPTFLGNSVAALEDDLEAVLCTSVVTMIDEDGQSLGSYDPSRLGTASSSRHTRFWARLHECWCKEVFGLIRTSTLAGTPLIQSFDAADRVLVAELALMGRFVVLDEPLFMNRDHTDRYTRTAVHDPMRNLEWYAASRTPRFVMQRWQLYGAFLAAVRRHGGDRAERLRCYAQLLRSLAINWNFVLLAIDPIVAVEPRVFVYGKLIKRRLLGYHRFSTIFERNTNS